DRAPDARCTSAVNGRAMRIFEATQGPRFSLLLFGGRGQTAEGLAGLAGGGGQGAAPLGGGVAGTLIPRQPLAPLPAHGGATLLDPSGEAHRHYGAAGGAIYLVRPDGYIAFRATLPDIEPLRSYLAAHFSFDKATQACRPSIAQSSLRECTP